MYFPEHDRRDDYHRSKYLQCPGSMVEEGHHAPACACECERGECVSDVAAGGLAFVAVLLLLLLLLLLGLVRALLGLTTTSIVIGTVAAANAAATTATLLLARHALRQHNGVHASVQLLDTRRDACEQLGVVRHCAVR
jgi:hypothetical protein